MVRFLLALIWIQLNLSVSTAADPAAPKSDDAIFTHNVTYAVQGERKMKLDFVTPKGEGPFPCVICFHGGAWRMGSRQELSIGSPWYDLGSPDRSVLRVLAEAGFAAASVTYRLAPDHKFPAQVEDAKTAIRFLRENAKKMNIDPDRFAAMGFSAGGHIASLVGTTDKEAGFEGTEYPNQSSRVRCVVDFFGPSDLILYCETPGIDRIFLTPFLGAAKGEAKEKLYKKASPIEHVTKEAPPFLIIHGTADVVVPIIHSERLHKKLCAAGVESELVCVKGKGHGWSGADTQDVNTKMIDFLSKHLKAKREEK